VYFARPEARSEPTVAYILDTSPRMAAPAEGTTRLSVAQGVMAEVVRPASPQVTAGLRVFGSGAVPQPCEDTQLVVPFAAANQPRIASELLGLSVGEQGDSSLAEAMIQAVSDLSRTQGPHSLVVVTGGSDSCNPLAGALIAQEAERAGIQLQTYVVGYQVSPEEAEAVKAIAEGTAGGTYHPAEDSDALRSILESVQDRIDTPLATGGGGSTACDHPYFPIRSGASWSYTGTVNSFSWAVTDVSGDATSATAHVAMNTPSGTLSLEWRCGPGGISYYTLSGLDFGEGSFQLTSQEGSALLPAGEFESGASWTNAYSITIDAGAGGFSISYTIDVQESLTAGEPGTVTVAAGSFEAVPVHVESQTSSSGGLADFSSSSTSTIWFAEGVGIVRYETTSEFGTYTSELTSYNIP
jgi:hypothetical protein